MTDSDLKKRKSIQLELQHHFRKSCPSFSDDIHVFSFGSTTNGFGFRHSDLDYYVKGISKNTAHALLLLHPEFTQVKQIKCRVPLVKFKHKPSGFTGDLSFRNAIALRNSLMLYRYSNISEKCKFVVFALKYLTKRCKIANAHLKFLSSYAYSLMAIHYLQQLEVPVLPILQEINAPSPLKRNSKYLVEGYDTYFYDKDNKALAEQWHAFGKNQQSISELFVGLLQYYAFEFDYANNSICIHKLQSPKTHNTVRDWITILDPFENERNLAVTLHHSTNDVIKTVFRNAYDHFNMLPKTKLRTRRDIMNHFFDPQVLLGEEYKRHRYFSNKILL